MIVVLCERRIYSNFTGEPYTHIYKVVLDHLLTQQKMLGSSADINIFTLEQKTQIFKMKKKKMMMEYEQVRKKNIFLHIYLFSSEMKRRRTTE